MHQLIGVIVEAVDEEEACDLARTTLDDLAGEGKSFDYYSTFGNENEKYAEERWGSYSSAMSAESEEGKKFIEANMLHTKAEFFGEVQKIREAFSIFTDEEIYQEEVAEPEKMVAGVLAGDLQDVRSKLRNIRYSMYCCGRHRGPDIFLYNQDGEGIRNDQELGWALKVENGVKLWVVPADVHY